MTSLILNISTKNLPAQGFGCRGDVMFEAFLFFLVTSRIDGKFVQTGSDTPGQTLHEPPVAMASSSVVFLPEAHSPPFMDVMCLCA